MYRLNPLFIRSQFQMKIISIIDARAKKSLNPLFIRSQFQISVEASVEPGYNESQSLIHQVSVSDSIYAHEGTVCHESQSLIHQVSVSD